MQFIGSDGECRYYVDRGFVFFSQRSEWSYGWDSPRPAADYSKSYCYAKQPYGVDHLRAEFMCRNDFAELVDPIQWALFPHQFSAWTLPENQEC
jgi:hypothetical protein